MTNFNLRELGQTAVGIIDERGWCQGKMFDLTGEVCAVGALWLAMGRTQEEALVTVDPVRAADDDDDDTEEEVIYNWHVSDLYPVFRQYVSEFPTDVNSVWGWSDRKGAHEVIRVLSDLPDVEVSL